MKKIIRRLLVFIVMYLWMSGTAHSQLWTVYSPVDITLSQVGSFTGGCYPNADFTFSFPGSQVTGVDFYLVVKQTPANGVFIMPYGDTLAIGDSLVMLPGTQMYSVFCFAGSGLVSFDIVAKGIPVVAGEPYPCSVPLWLSNLLLCPEGLLNGVSFNCATQATTGIDQAVSDDFDIIWPTSENNYHLTVSGNFDDAMVIDMLGRNIKSNQESGRSVFDLAGLPPGVYTLVLSDGSKRTARKFSFR